MENKSAYNKLPGSKRTCPNGHIYNKSSDCPVCPVCEKQKPAGAPFLQELGAPAKRALQNAGIRTLRDLAKWKEAEVLKLHGIGPSSIPRLRKALETAGLDFKA